MYTFGAVYASYEGRTQEESIKNIQYFVKSGKSRRSKWCLEYIIGSPLGFYKTYTFDKIYGIHENS